MWDFQMEHHDAFFTKFRKQIGRELIPVKKKIKEKL